MGDYNDLYMIYHTGYEMFLYGDKLFTFRAKVDGVGYKYNGEYSRYGVHYISRRCEDGTDLRVGTFPLEREIILSNRMEDFVAVRIRKSYSYVTTHFDWDDVIEFGDE